MITTRERTIILSQCVYEYSECTKSKHGRQNYRVEEEKKHGKFFVGTVQLLDGKKKKRIKTQTGNTTK